MARKRSPHPGIVVRPARPEKRERPHIRYREPETGKHRNETIPEGLEGAALDKWLRRKSAELMLRRARSTAPPGSLPVDALVEGYMRERHRLRESTRRQYRYTLDAFVEWLGKKPLSQERLRAWRAYLDRPGTSSASVNRDLAHTSAFLNHERKAGRVILTAEQISDALERLPDDHEKKAPFTRAEIRQLVMAVAGAGRYRDFVIATLLSGMRAEECRALNPARVEMDMDRIVLTKGDTKTRKGRVITFAESPTLRTTFRDFAGWGLTKHDVRELREQLHPTLTFQRMRVTCGTYLTCAPGIYGGASAYLSAARLGHSVQIAEKHYVGVVQVDPNARTLEAAMGIEDLLQIT